MGIWPRRIALTALFSAAFCAVGAGADETDSLLRDSVVGGWKVFSGKQCVHCHAIWGLGGEIGPDLGRSGQEHVTAAELAGALWNHIPKMQSHILRTRVEYPLLSLREVRDLFSFLSFVRHLDEPSDAAAGLRVLRDKGCTHCHFTAGESVQSAPDLKRWASYVNPIVWAQKMWEHAPKMERAMQEAGITWPRLDDTDLVNIMAYVRSVSGHEAKVYLAPGSAQTGKELFAKRKCRSCHKPGGPARDLATARLPRSLAALASRMWNHSPEMTRLMQARGIERISFTSQEMADIIAYILSFRHADRGGDPQRGQLIFQKKQCVRCHLDKKSASTAAPALETLAKDAAPLRLAHSFWNHGNTILDYMSETGLTWPMFRPGEMLDLIAYLRAVGPGGISAEPRGRPSSGPAAEAPEILPLPPIDPGESCLNDACHAGVVAGSEVHIPAAQGECDDCHALENPSTHQFRLLADNSDLCYECHDEPVETMKAHGPVAVSVCTACHDPHSAENLYGPNFTGKEVCFADMIHMTFAPDSRGGRAAQQPVAGEAPNVSRDTTETRQTPVGVSSDTSLVIRVGAVTLPPAVAAPTSIAGGCVTSDCHATVLAGAVVHAPTEQQACSACHEVVDESAHRFTLTAKEPELCYACHDRPVREASFVHGPVGLGLCTPCHDPHSAPAKFMAPAAGNELCYECHTEMASHVKGAKVQHEPVNEGSCLACHEAHRSEYRHQLKSEPSELCLDCHENVRDLIATALVSHDPVASEKGCSNCHNPHGSDVEGILADTEKHLCLGCHDRPMDTPNGPIIDMKSWIENNPEHHGPVRQGNCTGCHQPHGSKNFRLLQHSFPRNFYSPFSLETYALCFECHAETLVLDARTTTLTGFRNGDKNLHHMHVNQEKGRTCRACHEMHAGTKAKRMKDFVPFGNWKYPVNFEQTENGGRCAPGCHIPRAYDRRREITQK